VVAVAVAVTAVSKALEKLWAKRQARNGNASSVASQKLEKWDMDWRQDVDEELKKHGRDLYEKGGALRDGDHAVRNDTQVALGQLALATNQQYRDLRDDFREMGDKLDHLTAIVAGQTHHCSHCPEK
jgi:hypothetical protein